ncbi:MAG: hypothetical protein P1V35_02245 [Planctomycetota bacterium]|nr:hypothetical protein [Planctomycetota bacterium]
MENEQQGSGKKWFFGCCGCLVLFMVVLGGGGYFGAGYVKNKGATMMRESIAQGLENSELPQEETDSINADMERLEAAMKDWSVIEAIQHMGNFEQVADEVGTIGFHTLLLSYAQFVLPNTDIPEEERQAGRRTLQRFARGVDEGVLSLNQNDKAWKLDGHKSGDGPVEFNVEEVRAHLKMLKAQADSAEIPDEAYEVRLAEKVNTIVDALLAD